MKIYEIFPTVLFERLDYEEDPPGGTCKTFYPGSLAFHLLLHYGPEATPTNKKSTGRSESSSDTTMTSPVTKKNFKIGPLGDFEKSAFLYFHPSQYNLAPGIKGATDQILP